MKELSLLNENLKISSIEIAEATGKRHDHVVRDIEVLNKSYLKISFPKVGESEYTNSRGKKHKMYILTKMQCFDLITGYSAELRIKINRRWEYLEKEILRLEGLKIKSTEKRNLLTDEWKRSGISKPYHFINLTRAEYKSLGLPYNTKKKDLPVREIKRLMALESMEMYKLSLHEKKGYYECRDSLHETAGLIESIEKMAIQEAI